MKTEKYERSVRSMENDGKSDHFVATKTYVDRVSGRTSAGLELVNRTGRPPGLVAWNWSPLEWNMKMRGS